MKKPLLRQILSALGLATLLWLFFASNASAQEGGCSDITFSLDDVQPCCYRLRVNNASECYTELRLLLDSGSFVTWGASTINGWTGTLVNPTEIRLTHISGIIPFGESVPVGFCLPIGVSPTMTIAYTYNCSNYLAGNCFQEIAIEGCADPNDASIIGVKYRECGFNNYTNQPLLSGWTINLIGPEGNILAEQQTGADGSYAFYDLPAGVYVVREVAQDGWTPNLPQNGQATIDLSPSENAVQNFGNCNVGCNCNSLQTLVQQILSSEDSCCYRLTTKTQNSGAYCFNSIDVQVDAGQMITSWNISQPGWTVIPQFGSQSIEILPPNGFIPSGTVLPVTFCVSGSATHDIGVVTHFDNTSGNAECSAFFSFNCPAPGNVCNCSNGGTPGVNRIINGDFATTGGFTSDYAFNSSGPLLEGQYSIASNPHLLNAGFQACTDHTSGTGKMLIGNGGPNASAKIWTQTVTITPNTTYLFGAWVTSVVSASPALLQVFINNVSIGNSFQLSDVTCNWQQYCQSWFSGTNTTVTISILNLNTVSSGNDFAIDDISFRACSAAAPCHVTTSAVQIDNCGQVVLQAVATGPQPYTYQWCNGQTGPAIELNLPCQTYSCAVSVTCGDGSTATAPVSVVVSDNVPPTALCVPSFSIQFPGNTCSGTIAASSINAGSFDNCAIQSVSINPTLITGCGDHVVTLTATDKCNNTSTCTTNVYWAESIPPQIVCPQNVQIQCGATSPATTGSATATDNCSIPVVTSSSVQTGTQPCNATITRTWKAEDGCGNTATCIQTISINDNTKPIIVCPQNATVNTLPGQCIYTGTLTQPTATDNCDQSMVFTCSLLSGNQSILITPQTPFPKGVNNITCFAKDDCGNQSANCNYTLTVVDNQLPMITCPISISVVGTINPEGLCKAIVNGLAPTASDNCPMLGVNWKLAGPTIGQGIGDASGTNFMQGTTTVTYTALDMAGNSATCSFTVKVDCPPPVNNFCAKTVITYYSPASGLPMAAIYDTRLNSAAPIGNDWLNVATVNPPSWTPAGIGNVFGIALDNQGGEIYLAATDVYSYDAQTLNSVSGPGGTAGIYKTNVNLPGTTTPIVTTTNATSLPSYNSGTKLPNTGGPGNGIGNIVYDNSHNQLFVTNLEDGRIYRITPGGSLLSAYDPFQLDNAMPDIERPAERLWGIGIYKGRVYFAREKSSTNSKQIWSIGLTSTGEFAATSAGAGLYTGSQVSEISSVPGVLEKITDIEFSCDGRMLLAERGYAHTAGIYEYQKSGTWVSTGVPHFVGYGTGKNSAGGIDYGYKELAGNPTSLLDGLVWATGNCMPAQGISGTGGGCDIYGIEGISSAGGNAAAPSNAASDLFVDFNHSYGIDQKYQVGDVDVFKCGCPTEGSFCDSINITSTPSTIPTDTCCFTVAVHNGVPNFFSSIALCAQNGVSISAVSALSGWNIAGFGATMVTMEPPTTSVPVGTQTFLKFCLSKYQNIPSQQVIVKYYGPGPNPAVVCMDTLNYECSAKPKCLKIKNETVTCAPDGKYKLEFCVMASALIGWNTNSIQLNPPPGVIFTPNVFPVVGPLAPGGMHCTFTTIVSGAVHDGDQVCFSITAHQGNIAIGETPLQCCTDTVARACVKMPDCVCNRVSASAISVPSTVDSCCWKISLTNNYPGNYFAGIELEILTPGVVFGAIYAAGTGWALNYGQTVSTFKKKPVISYLGITEMLPVFCLAGVNGSAQVPQIVVVKWLDANSMAVCFDTLVLNCMPPDSVPCARLLNNLIKCSPIFGVYDFTFQVKNNAGFTADKVVLSNITGGIITPTSQAFVSPVGSGNVSTTVTMQISGLPGATVCFNLALHDLGASGEELNCCTNVQPYCFTLPQCDSCKCNGADNMVLHFSDLSFPVTCDNEDPISLPCDPQNQATFQLNGTLHCNGPDSCLQNTITWQVRNPNGVLITSGTNLLLTNNGHDGLFAITGLNYPSFTPGIEYTLTFTYYCGTKPCTCSVNFKIAPCNSCQCGPFEFEYSIAGGAHQTATCGQTISVANAFTFYPSFRCLNDPCGITFPQVNWTLTGPNNYNATGTEFATFSFNIAPLAPANFTTPGLYTLTMTGFCAASACPCVVYFSVPESACCKDYEVFTNLVAQGFVVTQNGCTITVCSPQFDSCQYFGTPPNFGDGTPVPSVVVPANGCWTHTYTQSGTYNICATVYEDTCWSKQICKPVNVQCTNCVCGSFSDLCISIGNNQPAKHMECNTGDTISLSCPPTNYSHNFGGIFSCVGNSCTTRTNPVHWILTGPTGTFTGTAISNPYFIFTLPPTYFLLSGVYTLTLQGSCNGVVCPPCVLKFKIDCATLCPCDIPRFHKAVAKGFAVMHKLGSCQACFSPLSLNDCDAVTWKVDGVPFSTTVGSQSVCHTFTNGTHTISMIVTRTKTNGMVCAVDSITRTIQIGCPFIVGPPLTHTSFPNATFADPGVIAGGLGTNGLGDLPGWWAPAGNPRVVQNYPGGQDSWSINLLGNLDTSDVLSRIEPVCLVKTSGEATLLIRKPLPADNVPVDKNLTRLVIGLYRGDNISYGWEGWELDDTHYRVGAIDVSPLDSSSWYEVQFDYDLSEWLDQDVCDQDSNAVSVRPEIYVTNWFGNVQGGEATYSALLIDQFYFGSTSVGTSSPNVWQNLRIFPNPNVGLFNIELPQPATPDMDFHVISLTGQVLLEKSAETGNNRQTVDAGILPPGLYFLQVMEAGKVIAVKKFVKQ